MVDALLDAEGVCVQARTRQGQAKRSASDGATRCIGAQYVASLDKSAAGGLIEMPRMGCPMLFAATTPDGRIHLVRTGPVTHFEEVSSGVHDRDRLPMQERVATDEIVVAKDRSVPDDQEMTTPFRKHRAHTRQNVRAVTAPPSSSVPTPARASLPPVQRASVPPPARRRPSPLPPPPSAAMRSSALPPPPRYHEASPVITQREVMFSLPEEDLVSDVGTSPVHRARREPTPAQRPSKRRR